MEGNLKAGVDIRPKSQRALVGDQDQRLLIAAECVAASCGNDISEEQIRECVENRFGFHEE